MAISLIEGLTELLVSSGFDPGELADATQLGAVLAEVGIDVSGLSDAQLDHLLDGLRAGGRGEDDPALIDAIMDALPQDDEPARQRDG